MSKEIVHAELNYIFVCIKKLLVRGDFIEKVY
jgi:hypothetical protein